jgi:hypothetical protein
LLVTGTTPAQEASFKVRATAFPACAWYEYRKAFKAKRTNRIKRNPGGPPWERIDGQGFTIWISEACLLDSRTVPPTWEIRLASLPRLNQAGQQCWQEVCEGIDRFLQESRLERVASENVAAEQRVAPYCGGIT